MVRREGFLLVRRDVGFRRRGVGAMTLRPTRLRSRLVSTSQITAGGDRGVPWDERTYETRFGRRVRVRTVMQTEIVSGVALKLKMAEEAKKRQRTLW